MPNHQICCATAQLICVGTQRYSPLLPILTLTVRYGRLVMYALPQRITAAKRENRCATNAFRTFQRFSGHETAARAIHVNQGAQRPSQGTPGHQERPLRDTTRHGTLYRAARGTVGTLCEVTRIA